MDFLNWFLDPVKNQYADFEGRATLKQYWMFVLVSVLISIAISIVEYTLGTILLGTIFSLAICIPNLAIGARRLHDIGKSGWWQLIVLVPVIGFIVLIVWLARKSDAGPNKYGSPKGFSVSAQAPASSIEFEKLPTDEENKQEVS